MNKKAEVKKWLDFIVDKLSEIGPYVAKDWGGSVQFIFTDIKTGWLMKLKMDGTVESLEEKIDEKNASATVETTTDVFISIYEKRVGPLEATAQGTMKSRGSLDGLMKVLAPTLE